MRNRGRLIGTVLFVVLAGAPRRASAIIDGTVDPPPSSVVAISGQTSSGASGLVCTGTLVAPNVVLTARHCVEEGDPGCMATFTGVARYVSVRVTTDNNPYDVARTIVPTGSSPCGDDIALLVLASAVPSTDSPVADVRLTKAAKGEAYSAVGYGRICPEDGAQCSSNGQRRRKDGLAVQCIDCRVGTWSGTPDSACVGDSGGPAFDAQNRVFGVTTVGGLGCTTAYYTRVDRHADFLRDTVKAETAKAGLGAPFWTTVSETGAEDGGAPGADAGASSADGGTSAAAASGDDGGCSVAVRGKHGSSSTWNVVLATLAVLVTWACRRSTRPARTTTNSASTTRIIDDRTIRTAITRSSTTSRSSS